ncbi:adenylate/guanylate cyclase domain-containing protein [Myroides odoratimimus]|uniref:adenylate/guanylate cyclase domain-containing protein n=1 Tax=Myroides odoratimimus TaxID=76832 RepID=UPI003100D6D2
MALKDDIKSKVKAILDEKFTVTDVTYIPKIDDQKLTFGNTGLKFKGSSLFIDLRGSTNVLNTHNKTTVGKLHMAFFHTIVKIANSHNGNVRSFNGDSTLIFFEGNLRFTLSTAVRCAMEIKYMIDNSQGGINELLKKYSKLDFGIGIDHGEILCTKVGIGGEHNRDIFWIGNPVNKSTVLGDASKAPYHIAISGYVYSNLLDWAKYHTKTNAWGQEEKVDMWTRGIFTYNGKNEYFYYTSYFWRV